jgi:hypothetical protein
VTATQGGGPPDTTNTGPGNTCENFCAIHGQTCFGGNECMEFCNQVYQPGCEPEADAFVQCLTGQITGDCELPPGACEDESFLYNQCVEPNPNECFTDFCEGGDGTCECFGPCFGFELQQTCFTKGPGGNAICDCWANGDYIGQCGTSGNICSIEEGCCQSLLLEGGGGDGDDGPQ